MVHVNILLIPVGVYDNLMFLVDKHHKSQNIRAFCAVFD